jgi:hypothetical protein
LSLYSRGVIKEAVLARGRMQNLLLRRVDGNAKLCFKKSLPSKVVDTVANKKLNLKICPEKHDRKLVESPKLGRSCHGPPPGYGLWVALWKGVAR